MRAQAGGARQMRARPGQRLRGGRSRPSGALEAGAASGSGKRQRSGKGAGALAGSAPGSVAVAQQALQNLQASAAPWVLAGSAW